MTVYRSHDVQRSMLDMSQPGKPLMMVSLLCRTSLVSISLVFVQVPVRSPPPPPPLPRLSQVQMLMIIEPSEVKGRVSADYQMLKMTLATATIKHPALLLTMMLSGRQTFMCAMKSI